MDTTIFIEIDEKMQNTDMALDELLRMNLPKEAQDALNMIIENLTAMIPMLSTVRENYLQTESVNKNMTKVLQNAKKQMNDLDIEMGD